MQRSLNSIGEAVTVCPAIAGYSPQIPYITNQYSKAVLATPQRPVFGGKTLRLALDRRHQRSHDSVGSCHCQACHENLSRPKRALPGLRSKGNIESCAQWTSKRTLTTNPVHNFGHPYPEKLTVESLLPEGSMVIISAFEDLRTCDAKTNVYSVFFFCQDRRWCRIDIILRIGSSSKFWAAASVSPQLYETVETLTLVGDSKMPKSLHARMQKYLRGLDLVDDCTVAVDLSLNDELRQMRSQTEPIESPSIELQGTWIGALNFLDDLGCRLIEERAVVQIGMQDPPHRFVSFLDGTVVLETRFASDSPRPEHLYTIQVLNALGRSPFISSFYGVVIDSASKRLKSYLTEWADERENLEYVASNPDISWTQREQWARQLLIAVQEVHSKGWVVGTLIRNPMPIVVRRTNTVQLWSFKRTFQMGYTGGSYYPPEHRHLRWASKAISDTDSTEVSSKTDIFHLGLLLWLLAENAPRTNNSPFCIREKCNLKPHGCQNPDHFDPVTLPKLPSTVPQYYRDMVDQCRAENPSDRPAAWSVLERFPDVDLDDKIDREESKPGSLSLDHIRRRNYGSVSCDGCRKRHIGFNTFYHCTVCEFGDFEICDTCFDRGLHCLDETHFLAKVVRNGSFHMSEGFYSRVQSSGERIIIDV